MLVSAAAWPPGTMPIASLKTAGDAERPVHVADIVPEALALEDGCLDLLDTVEDVNAVASFPP